MTEPTEDTFVVNGKLARMAEIAGRYCDAMLAEDNNASIIGHMLGLTADGRISVMPLTVPGEMIDEARETLFEKGLQGEQPVFQRMLFFCEAWTRSVPRGTERDLRGSLADDPKALEAVVFEGRDSAGNHVKCGRLIDRDAGKLGEPKWVPPTQSRYLPSVTDERRR